MALPLYGQIESRKDVGKKKAVPCTTGMKNHDFTIAVTQRFESAQVVGELIHNYTKH